MKKHLLFASVFAAALAAMEFTTGCRVDQLKADDSLVGAWRGKVQFTSGALATTKDLEFMYAFNAGGTMTESSNYDSSPPGPPAYGVWRRVGPNAYEARYEFFWVKAPAGFDEIAKGGGWAPDGYGILTQKISLVADGNTFTSTIKSEMFDRQGQPAEGGGEATGRGERIRF